MDVTASTKTGVWKYQKPWLSNDGLVWVHIGYGNWQLLPSTDARAESQLQALQRANYRDSRQHTLVTWLIQEGHLERKETIVAPQERPARPEAAQVESPRPPSIQSASQPALRNLNIIEKPLGIPLTVQDFIGQRVALLGISGSGKTNSAAAIIEELIPYLPMTIIDIEGEYHTLKTLFKVLVVGRSPNCDIDVPTIHAESLAEYAYANNVNVVLDFKYHDHEEEMFEFCELYFERIWKMAIHNPTPKPYEIVIEESHEFIPQSSNTPISKLFKRIATRGRKHGLGVILASQRSTLVDKNVLTQAGIYFLHRVVHPKDMQVYKDFIPLKPADVETLVGQLQPGECVFMRDHKPQRAKIRKRYTVHAGSTPTLGQPATGNDEKPELKQIDAVLLDDLRSMFNAPPKDDHAAMRVQIAELEQRNTLLQIENGDLRKKIADLERDKKDYVGQDVPATIKLETTQADGAPSIVEIAAEKVVTAEERAYRQRVSNQEKAFQKVLSRFSELPNWQRFSLAYMTETGKSYSLERLANAIGVQPKTATDKPLTELRDWEFVSRTGSRGNYVFTSRLDQQLKANYPDLDSDELKKKLFKTVKELA